METIDIQQVAPETEKPIIPPKSDSKFPVKFTPVLKILSGFLIFIILLNLILLLRPKNTTVNLIPTPSPIVVKQNINNDPPKNLSEFSKLPEYQAFEQQLQNSINKNDSLDLSTSKLNFPLLEMNIKFTQ